MEGIFSKLNQLDFYLLKSFVNLLKLFIVLIQPLIDILKSVINLIKLRLKAAFKKLF